LQGFPDITVAVMKKSISIIIPVFNEEKNISLVHDQTRKVCEAEGYDYEIIVIDDGSSDGTAKLAKSLYPIKYIRFRKNFGQTAAIDAGIKYAKNDYIITLDGDGQNDPVDIPRLIRHLEANNLDVVSGWRKNRQDPVFKRFVSRGANFLRKMIINDQIHDSGCTLKVYKRECFHNITLFGEMHRFIPALLRIRGFNIGELEISHHPRKHQVTKYNWKRIIKGFLDMVGVWFWNKFAVRPLHLLGGTGLLTLLLGFLSGIYTLTLFFKGIDLSNNVFPLLTAFLLISGTQLFVFGLIGDILSKHYYSSNNEQHYFIQEIIENDGSENVGRIMKIKQMQK
jgi:glycosyltransferase involved in cell wall biosynthesis